MKGLHEVLHEMGRMKGIHEELHGAERVKGADGENGAKKTLFNIS